MLSVVNGFFAVLSRLISVFFSAFFGVWTLLGGVAKEPPAVPEDFTPVLRFAVCSDVHLDGDPAQQNAAHFRSMFRDLYAYAETQAYAKVDALLVVGDFANTGAPEEYALFNAIAEENLKPETRLLTVLGNHEFIKYRDVDASVGYDVYREYVNKDVDTHVVINGYHFIGVSYDADGKRFRGKRAWLKAELRAAVGEDPEKPVFVYQHPHPFTTVYGSVNWSDFDVRAVLSQFPQTVDFSGHSHYAASDPRSVWQGEFTAVGTGALCAYMSNLNYVSGDEDAPGESGGFWIVEADADGGVRLQLMDVVNHVFFKGAECWLTDIADPTRRVYTWGNRMALDTAPAFPAGAGASIERTADGGASLCFPDAAGYYEAENYKITVRSGSETVLNGTVVSDYVRAVHTGMRVDLGELPAGTYAVSVTAFSPYGKKGETLKTTAVLE